MDQIYIPIFAGLAASIFTVLVSNVLLFWKERIQFKRELKKVVFLKKLEKAEEAISYNFTYYSKLIEMKAAFSVIKRKLSQFDGDISGIQALNPLLSNISNLIIKLNNDYLFGANAIHLYYEIDNNTTADEAITDLITSNLVEMKSIEIEFTGHFNDSDRLYDSGNYSDSEKAFELGETAVQKYLEKLDITIKLMDTHIDFYKRMVTSIKSQLSKKYFSIKHN